MVIGAVGLVQKGRSLGHDVSPPRAVISNRVAPCREASPLHRRLLRCDIDWPKHRRSRRRWRLLSGIELHVECGQQRRGRRIIAHQSHEVDQLAAAELLQGPRKGVWRNPPLVEDFAAEIDDDRIGLG